jgi:hypothetical protein
MPKEQLFGHIMTRTTYFWWNDDVCSKLDQHTELDFYSNSSLIQQSMCKPDAALGHIMSLPPISSQPIFALTSYCHVFSEYEANTNLMVFGLTWTTWTHNLQDSS